MHELGLYMAMIRGLAQTGANGKPRARDVRVLLLIWGNGRGPAVGSLYPFPRSARRESSCLVER